jgi:hypothetical protein
MVRTRFLVFLASAAPVIAFLMLFVGEVHASSGNIHGTLYFHNKNGNFCPTGEDCTGTKYPESLYDVLVPIPEAEVQILRASDDAVIGSGETDANGEYSIWWGSGSGTSAVTGKIRVRYRHADGRFFFHTLSTPHVEYAHRSGNITLPHGQFLQQSWFWGTSASPSAVANAYWAAWKLWNGSLKSSSRMQAYFTDVDILAFESLTSPVTDAPCNATSCARGWYRDESAASGRPWWAEQKLTVVLDGLPSTPFAPQERTMHELGHIADFVAGLRDPLTSEPSRNVA